MGLMRLGAKAIKNALAEKKEKKKLSEKARGVVFVEDVPEQEKEAYLALGESYWDYNKRAWGGLMSSADGRMEVKKENLQLLVDVFMSVHNQTPDQVDRIKHEIELVLKETQVRKDVKQLTEGEQGNTKQAEEQSGSKPENGSLKEEMAAVSHKVYRQMKPEAVADITFDPDKLQKYAMIFKVIDDFFRTKMGRNRWFSFKQKEIFNLLADYVIASEGLDASKKGAFIEKLERSFHDSGLVEVEEITSNEKEKKEQLTDFLYGARYRFAEEYLEQLRQGLSGRNKDFPAVHKKVLEHILRNISRETNGHCRKIFDRIPQDEVEKLLMEVVNGGEMPDVVRKKMVSKKNEICSIYVNDLWGERFEKLVPAIVESGQQIEDIIAGAGAVLKEKYNLPDDYVELISPRLKTFLTAQYVRGINFEKVAQKDLNEEDSRKLVNSIYRSLDEIFSGAEEYAGGFMADKKAELKRYYVVMLQSGIRTAFEAVFRTMISPYGGTQIAKLQKELDENPEDGQRAGEIEMEIGAIREGHHEVFKFLREHDPAKLAERIKKIFAAYDAEDLFEPFWAELTGFMGQGKFIKYLIPKGSPWQDVIFKRR